MTKTNEYIGPVLRSFFCDYLIRQRGVSANTQLAYRDALRLFLIFVAGRLNRPVTALSVTDLTAERVLLFLDDMESVRKVKVVTRNQRLAAVHAFFRFAAFRDPLWIGVAQQVLAIPYKRADIASLPYLTREALSDLLQKPDRTTLAGRRDYALFAFLYNTGCRVQEALDIRVADLNLTHPASVRLVGKGRKERYCSLWSQTVVLIREHLEERRVLQQSDAAVFVNRHGQQLTRFGVRYLLRKYQGFMDVQHLPCALHPHLMRHTSAVHMLQAGMDLNSVRNQLGHTSVTTTCIYTEVDLQMKRAALEKAGLASSIDDPATRDLPDEVLAWLESL